MTDRPRYIERDQLTNGDRERSRKPDAIAGQLQLENAQLSRREGATRTLYLSSSSGSSSGDGSQARYICHETRQDIVGMTLV